VGGMSDLAKLDRIFHGISLPMRDEHLEMFWQCQLVDLFTFGPAEPRMLHSMCVHSAIISTIAQNQRHEFLDSE
jgi:hypothetical protein